MTNVGRKNSVAPLPASDAVNVTLGSAVRQYLALGRLPVLRPVTEAARFPGKRYADPRPIVLPHGQRREVSPPSVDLTMIGDLMRSLLGVDGFSWRHGGPMLDASARDTVQVVPRRPVPSGGARYPMEAYLAGGSFGVPVGLYHYSPAQHALEHVRSGDCRGELASAILTSPVWSADLLIVLAGVFWRTAVKYGEYAYRLLCQETGALAAQFLVLAESAGTAGLVHTLFDGRTIDGVLDLDQAAEGSLAVLSLSRSPLGAPAEVPGVADGDPGPVTAVADGRPERVTGRLPRLLALHRSATSVPSDTGPVRSATDDRPPGSGVDVVALPAATHVPLVDGIRRRRSAPAGFGSGSISAHRLAQLLTAAVRGRLDGQPDMRPRPATCEIRLFALRVDGVPPGAYRYDPESGGLIRTARWEGVWPVAEHLLGHARLALGEAAAVVLPVGDPLAGLEQFGDAWYRLQQTEVGMMTHQVALTSAAVGLWSRIHSEICGEHTDAALGLADSAGQTLGAVLVGTASVRTTEL